MSRKNILIIEDDNSIRLILGRILVDKYDVSTTKDGLEAMLLLSQGQLPDLIILDMFLPGMTGLEFLTQIRRSGFYKHIPVIVLSGSVDEYKERCTKLGATDFFVKPFDPIKMKDAIIEALDK
jgi:two-component system, chemotaxis family, chemotaxis protein CheY